MNAGEKWVAFDTLFRKETIRIIRIWPQTILPAVITMTLYFIVFGHFIGSRIEGVNGVSYIAFIVPGIIMMSVLTNAYTNVSSSFFSSKFQRSIEELLVSPTPNWIILLGYVAGGIFRGLIIGVLVLVVSLFFTKLHLYNVFIVLAFIVLASIVFSLAGFLNGIFAKTFDDISIIPTFVITPLTYLGGVFYSLQMLPPVWQKISLLNPILYMVNGFRYGFLETSDINVWIGFSMLILLTVVLVWANLYLMKKGVGLKN